MRSFLRIAQSAALLAGAFAAGCSADLSRSGRHDDEGGSAGAAGAGGEPDLPAYQGGSAGAGGTGEGPGQGGGGIGSGGANGEANGGEGGQAGAGTAGSAGGQSGGAGGTGGTMPAGTAGRCGEPRPVFPDATNTGVPSGTILKPSASLTIRTSGTVIDGLDITGCIDIQASNVTIRRTRIKKACREAINIALKDPPHTGILIEDTEIDGNGSLEGVAIVFTNFTLCRVHVHDALEAARMSADVFVQDSYFRNMRSNSVTTNAGPPRGRTSNIVVRHNTFDDPIAETSWNALLGADTAHGVPDGILVENNLLLGGPLSIAAKGVRNLRILNNRVSTRYFARGGRYGTMSLVDLQGATIAGNVWHETGMPFVP